MLDKSMKNVVILPYFSAVFELVRVLRLDVGACTEKVGWPIKFNYT